MTHFKIACAAVAAMTLLTVFAIGRSPDPPVPQPDNSFDRTWREAAGPAALVTTAIEMPPKTVKTEVVKLENPPTESPLKEEPPPPPPKAKPQKTKFAETNVCTRHNMRKVRVGRYSWRCRK